MTWVLIIIAGAGYGIAMSIIPGFSTKDNCEKAGVEYQQGHTMMREYVCVEKK